MTSKKFITYDEIIKKLNEKFGTNNILIVSTKDYDLTTLTKHGNNNIDRANWADYIVEKYYELRREDIGKNLNEEINFAYIKFAINKNGDSFGIVHGKSSFHHNYPSDVLFYDLKSDDLSKRDLKNAIDDNKLIDWDTDKIVIIKNNDYADKEEAKQNERWIRENFNTYD